VPNDPQSQAYFRSVVPQARVLFRQGYDTARETVRAGDLASVVALVRSLHQTIDGMGRDHVAKAASAGNLVECAAGCWYCCHQTITVSAAEAVTIAAFLRAQARAVPDLAAHARAIDGLDPPARYAKGLPCPLLQDQCCSIYADRPETCRSYLSLSRARCERYMAAAQDAGLVILRDPHTLHPFLMAGADWWLAQAGLQMVSMELSGLLAQALAPGACDRWAAGEAVFTPPATDDYPARLAHVARAMMTAGL
jgi:hypothetical protein